MKIPWSYGPEGAAYPVRPGESWECGPHRFHCGDLERGAARHAIALAPAMPRLAYIDPPWGPGLASSFRTKAGPDVAPGKADFGALLRAILGPLAARAIPTLIEMGEQWANGLAAMVGPIGGRVLANHRITYDRGRPARLLAVGFGGLLDHALSQWSPGLDTDDTETPGLAIRDLLRPNDVVVDLCMGRGGTAIAAHKSGRIAVGCELNPRRLSACLARLAMAGGGEPRRIPSGAADQEQEQG